MKKSHAIAYVIAFALLAAVDYLAVRELALGTINRAFEYIVLFISTLIVATMISRLFARRR